MFCLRHTCRWILIGILFIMDIPGSQLSSIRMVKDEYDGHLSKSSLAWSHANKRFISLPSLCSMFPFLSRCRTTVRTTATTTTTTTSTAVIPYSSFTGGNALVNNMQPSLVLLQIVPTSFSSNLSILRTFAFNFAPGNNPQADGRVLSTSSYPSLFSALGKTFGGDGLTTFNLPNLQGVTVIGTGQASDLSSYTLGKQIGSEQITLMINQMAQHTHSILGSDQPTGTTGGSQTVNNLQSSLAMHYIICTSGTYPSFDLATGTLPFIGQIALQMGTTIPSGWVLADGSLLQISQNQALFSIIGTIYGGDGRSTFQLPDLRGRTPIGVATGSSTQLGEMIGIASITLTTDWLPSHQHTLISSTYTVTQTNVTGGGQSFQNVQPSLGITFLIATSGVFPSRDNSVLNPQNPILGEVIAFAGNTVPKGWSKTDGSLLPISSNVALFALVGTTYGGNGQSNFALPDLRDRVIIGSGGNYAVGQATGSSTITLSINQLPAHRHTLPH